MTDHPSAIGDVIAECLRQQSEEGFSPEHDDQHESGELAAAAGSYASHASMSDHYRNEYEGPPLSWPIDWDESWWKPTTRRRDLVKAAALIIAEIERLDRAAEKTAIATCEACGHAIQEGEAWFPGPETSFCAKCAPTWQAMIDEPEGFVTLDGEPMTPEQCRAEFDEHIAAGGKPTDSMARVV